jgi:hypothetical protein
MGSNNHRLTPYYRLGLYNQKLIGIAENTSIQFQPRLTDALMLADGSIPMLPVIIEASSDKISPKRLLVTIVSNCKNSSIERDNDK